MKKAAREAQIMVVIKNPGEAPRIEPLFENTLEAFQAAVGGYIEAVTVCSDMAIICNEEGRLRALPYNTNICGCSFFGPILIVGVDGEDFASLNWGGLAIAQQMLGEEATP